MKKYVIGLLVFGLAIGTMFAATQMIGVHIERIYGLTASMPLSSFGNYVKIVCFSAATENPAFTNTFTLSYTNSLMTSPSVIVGPITFTGSWYYANVSLIFDPSTVFLYTNTDTNGIISYGYEFNKN